LNRTAVLVLGDLAVFFVFGALGLASHEDALNLKTIARAILVFPVAWFVIAPWFGAFSAGSVAGQSWGPDPQWLARVALIWLVAGVVALCARALIFDRSLFSAFFVIALVGNGVLLLAWRAAYAVLFARSMTRATG